MMHLLPYEGKCPFCKSWDILHFIGKDEMNCISCGKSFTKEEAQKILGEIVVSTRAYESLRK